MSTVAIVFQSPNEAAVLTAILQVPRLLMTIAAWVTLVFAALEYVSVHYPDKCPSLVGLTHKWNPAKLPPLEKTPLVGKRPKRYSHAVAEIVFGFLFLGWFMLVLQL